MKWEYMKWEYMKWEHMKWEHIRQMIKLFQIGLRQIATDGMLLVLLPAPCIIGLVFRFMLPYVNSVTMARLSISILPWYSLADSLLVCLTPMMTAAICAFLLLEERDEGVSAFYQVTPVGDYAYLVARIGLPMLGAFVYTTIITMLFRLTDISIVAVFSSSIVSTLAGIFLAMAIVSFAGNRVEGLALSKMMGISLLGLAAVWFVPHPYQYFASFLPAFWVGKLITEGAGILPFGCGLLLCLVWIGLLTRKFMRRI